MLLCMVGISNCLTDLEYEYPSPKINRDGLFTEFRQGVQFLAEFPFGDLAQDLNQVSNADMMCYETCRSLIDSLQGCVYLKLDDPVNDPCDGLPSSEEGSICRATPGEFDSPPGLFSPSLDEID